MKSLISFSYMSAIKNFLRYLTPNYFTSLLVTSPWALATVVFIACALLIGLFSYHEYPISWDYEAHDTYGKQVVDFYSTLGKDSTAALVPMKHYGAGFEIFANLFRYVFPGDYYETKHLGTFLFALIGVVGTSLCAASLSGARAGFLAALMLLLTPMYYGHAYINHKDIPLAVTYIWGVYATILSTHYFPKISLKSLFFLGLCFGLILSIRAGAFFFIGVIGFHWGIFLAREFFKSRLYKKTSLVTTPLLAAKGLVVLCVAWIVMCILWPYGLLHPLDAPLSAIIKSSQYPWSYPILFGGKFFIPPQIPPYYIGTWFLLQLPEFLLLSILISLFLALSHISKEKLAVFGTPKALSILTLLFSIALPVAAVIIQKSIVYDAVRHFIFILPVLSVLCALGIDHFLNVPTLSTELKRTTATIFIFLITSTTLELGRLHPYQYAYTNHIVAGGLAKSFDRYENDYWALCMKESVEWLASHTSPKLDAPSLIAGWSDDLQLQHPINMNHIRRPDFAFTKNELEADYYIATNRFDGNNKPYPLLHTISREGAPLCYIFKRK